MAPPKREPWNTSTADCFRAGISSWETRNLSAESTTSSGFFTFRAPSPIGSPLQERNREARNECRYGKHPHQESERAEQSAGDALRPKLAGRMSEPKRRPGGSWARGRVDFLR